MFEARSSKTARQHQQTHKYIDYRDKYIIKLIVKAIELRDIISAKKRVNESEKKKKFKKIQIQISKEEKRK